LLVVSLALVVLQGLVGAGVRPPPTKGSASALIAVIVPDAVTSSMVDALNRLRGEAMSVGFEIRLVQAQSSATPRAKLEQIARELLPAAVVALSSPERDAQDPQAPPTIDIWFLDRASGQISLGHLPVETNAGTRAEQALAIAVVDFIRARMFDSLVHASVEAKVAAPRPLLPIALGRYQVLAGLGVVGSSSGFATAWVPVVEAGFALRPWLRLSLAGGGWGSRFQRRTSAGSMAIEQRLLKMGAALVAPVLARRWYLHAETGLSLSYVASRGDGSTGYAGQEVTGFSPGIHWLGGVVLALTAHIVLQASLGALWLTREQQVFIADDRVARTGHPIWLGSAMVGVMF
jgi:hypothetical protein